MAGRAYRRPGEREKKKKKEEKKKKEKKRELDEEIIGITFSFLLCFSVSLLRSSLLIFFFFFPSKIIWSWMKRK
jgi:hypothetical protein